MAQDVISGNPLSLLKTFFGEPAEGKLPGGNLPNSLVIGESDGLTVTQATTKPEFGFTDHGLSAASHLGHIILAHSQSTQHQDNQSFICFSRGLHEFPSGNQQELLGTDRLFSQV